MSEWVKNTSIVSNPPPPLESETEVFAKFTDGVLEKGRAGRWNHSWNTEHALHITHYKVFDEEEGETNAPATCADDKQVGGSHYKSLKVQPWDACESWATKEQFEGYLLLSAISYLSRYNSEADGKGGIVDVKKAIHYLEKLIETKEKTNGV